MPGSTTYNEVNAWTEIYNPQDQPLDLYQAHASIDEGSGTESYTLPIGSIIEAHGFLVVFPFTGASPISQVRLTISQTVIDEVPLPLLSTNTSYARIPDGADKWQITTTPTIASSNILNGVTSSDQSSGTGQAARATPTQKHTPGQRSTGTNGSATDTPSIGVQPTWGALRLPSPGASSTEINDITQDGSSPPVTPGDSFDLLRKILFTVLLVVLSFALVGGWWVYKRK
jgi:hypothetical protein